MNQRLLSCAFAAADLLFEIGPDHRIRMAVGAGVRLTGQSTAQLMGSDWRDWLSPADREMATAFIEGLVPGDRRGPITLKLSDRTRLADLTALAMPELSPAVSCALSNRGSSGADDGPKGAYGLHDLTSFEAAAERLRQSARAEGGRLDLSLVRVPMPGEADAGRRALARLAGVLRAEAVGGAAAQIGADRFALLRDDIKPNRLEQQIAKAAGGEPDVATASIAGPGSSRYMVGAIRSALRRFTVEAPGVRPTDIIVGLQAELAKVAAHAQGFARAVQERSFKLAYQPIVALRDGGLDHYEALVRFEDGESPAETIKMAEDLGMIEALDLAMSQSVVDKLKERSAASLKLAVNLSTRSLMSDDFLGALLDILAANAELNLTGRLSFEITETSQLIDLTAANIQIQRLREAGFKVALDDLGAGAASLSYLRELKVDAVKIDGAYVRSLLDDPRNEAVLSHLVALCRDLGLTTTAEMIESPKIEARLKAIGVDFGQGWLYGRPESEPRRPATAPPVLARRKGTVESWG